MGRSGVAPRTSVAVAPSKRPQGPSGAPTAERMSKGEPPSEPYAEQEEQRDAQCHETERFDGEALIKALPSGRSIRRTQVSPFGHLSQCCLHPPSIPRNHGATTREPQRAG